MRALDNAPAAMTTDLPFDPPYKLALDTPQGKRWVEVLADGSQVDTTPPATTLPPPGTRVDNAPRGGNGGGGGASAKAQVFLNVPFAEKDEAKRLGARWDPTRKKWYVPNGVDAEQFSRWTA
ncbi:DUF5710 domain-containing protein [Pseudoduganella sp. SL102]|uniref:DUF5710 domain-containing protein n=1 Tax=Pseudoduganella sp. SL102 TaxID=2995154 RepID=UPI00248ABE61|nr:DUF5710 domain-containing protein [Pseudoduganella sp. SL102]WBS05346.1 DUF5710 domain-containing protein [Pseudoduganella sp. SL102]